MSAQLTTFLLHSRHDQQFEFEPMMTDSAYQEPRESMMVETEAQDSSDKLDSISIMADTENEESNANTEINDKTDSESEKSDNTESSDETDSESEILRFNFLTTLLII